jgi:hypothetical protein
MECVYLTPAAWGSGLKQFEHFENFKLRLRPGHTPSPAAWNRPGGGGMSDARIRGLDAGWRKDSRGRGTFWAYLIMPTLVRGDFRRS